MAKKKNSCQRCGKHKSRASPCKNKKKCEERARVYWRKRGFSDSKLMYPCKCCGNNGVHKPGTKCDACKKRTTKGKE